MLKIALENIIIYCAIACMFVFDALFGDDEPW